MPGGRETLGFALVLLRREGDLAVNQPRRLTYT